MHFHLLRPRFGYNVIIGMLTYTVLLSYRTHTFDQKNIRKEDLP